MLAVLNALAGRLVDRSLAPFRPLPPLVGLVALALALAAGAVLVLKLTSNQAALVATRRRMRSILYEMRLFANEPRAIPRAVGDMLACNLAHVRLLVVPLLVTGLPLAALLPHVQAYYGYAGLEPGQSALVKVRVAADSTGRPALDVPPGIRLVTPAVWSPALREAAWRIVADRTGDYELVVTVDRYVARKSLRVSGVVGRRSPVRLKGTIANQWRAPAEPPLAGDAPIDWIAITYQARTFKVLGWRLGALEVCGLLSALFAIALQKPLKVVL